MHGILYSNLDSFVGSSPAQASVAPEETNVGHTNQKFSKKDNALFDSSGTSASGLKDPANSESEYYFWFSLLIKEKDLIKLTLQYIFQTNPQVSKIAMIVQEREEEVRSTMTRTEVIVLVLNVSYNN